MTSTNGKRTAARKRETRDFRYGLCEEIGRCEVCGKRRPTDNLCVHELARGNGIRQKALDKRFAVLVVCALHCHDKVQNEPLTRQLARLYLARGGADYDRVAFNRLRGRADDAISQEEVDEQIEWLLNGGLAE